MLKYIVIALAVVPVLGAVKNYFGAPKSNEELFANQLDSISYLLLGIFIMIVYIVVQYF